MTQGVPYSAARLAILPAVILILWAADELQSTLLIPWAIPYLVALDAVVLIGTAIGFAPIAQRMTQVHRETSGSGTYRIGFSIAALFVAAFVLRLIIAVSLYPTSLEFGSVPGGFPPMSQQIVLAVIDGLFSMSTGLIAGRSIGISRRWAQSASERPPS